MIYSMRALYMNLSMDKEAKAQVHLHRDRKEQERKKPQGTNRMRGHESVDCGFHSEDAAVSVRVGVMIVRGHAIPGTATELRGRTASASRACAAPRAAIEPCSGSHCTGALTDVTPMHDLPLEIESVELSIWGRRHRQDLGNFVIDG